jgi:N-methylhydantoinase A
MGLLTADAKFDASLTRVLGLEGAASEQIAAVYEELEAKVLGEVDDLLDLGQPRWSRYAYMRYAGQGYELKVDLPDGEIGEGYAGDVAPAFHEAYRRNYGYAQPESPIEGVDWYLVATFHGSDEAAGVSPNGRPRATVTGLRGPRKQPRQAYFPETGGYADCEVLDRYGMAPQQRFSGPAVVEERESTTVVPPGDAVHVSEGGHLVVEIGGGE